MGGDCSNLTKEVKRSDIAFGAKTGVQVLTFMHIIKEVCCLFIRL